MNFGCSIYFFSKNVTVNFFFKTCFLKQIYFFGTIVK